MLQLPSVGFGRRLKRFIVRYEVTLKYRMNTSFWEKKVVYQQSQEPNRVYVVFGVSEKRSERTSTVPYYFEKSLSLRALQVYSFHHSDYRLVCFFFLPIAF